MKKKHWISAALVLLLLLLMPASAWADVIYPAPEDFTVGVEVDHLLATLSPGGTVWTDPELLPDGLRLETEETASGIDVYLRGVPSTPGTYDLIIRYNGNDSICTLHILPEEGPGPGASPVSVAVNEPPVKLSYTVGDTLDPAGLSLLLTMSDGSTRTVAEGYTLYPTRLDSAGTRRIEVNLEGLLCYFDVTVEPAPEEILGIGVLTPPDKIFYEPGEALDPAGLSIRVYTNNGARDVSAEELNCSPTQLDEPGKQRITVSYEGFECRFEVTVLEEEAPASMAVLRYPTRRDYQVGDVLDTEGLILVVTSNRDSHEYLDEGYLCEPEVLNTPGEQEITVRFGELSCSFPVYVREAPGASAPAAEVSPASSAEAVPTGSAQQEVRISAAAPEEDPILSGRALMGVILVAAFLALGVLGFYVFFMNRSGKEFFAETVRDVFRRRR